MHIHHLHRWDITPQEAIALQKDMAGRVIHDTPLDLAALRFVAGVDVSVKGDISQAAVVVLSYPALRVVESVTATRPTPFPYIPGLLSFREGPVLVEAFEKLQTVPDVFLFDGMGRIHPRRIGIASHMGLWLDKPAVGCGKTHLI
ncbi:endonuclease V, partial [bacterium]|nr:endonuclease V [bacterium]